MYALTWPSILPACRCFFLHRPRIQLFDRILARVQEMVAGGLLQESSQLLDAGLTSGSHVASRAIGYRQAMAFMQEARENGGATMQQLVQLVLDIAAMSRRLVKGQMTWFRGDDMYRWVGTCCAVCGCACLSGLHIQHLHMCVCIVTCMKMSDAAHVPQHCASLVKQLESKLAS